jgi:hypothetical protein
MTQNERQGQIRNALRTPPSAAIAGILFALLFSAGAIIVHFSLPADALAEGVTDKQWITQVKIAIGLVPYTGIAFLWFVGVMRDRLGELEDRFFSTIFFGSGLLFLAIIFVSAAMTAGLLTIYAVGNIDASNSVVYIFGWKTARQLVDVYAIRMAGVFMFSAGTMWLQTGVMPRWMAFLTYILALFHLLTPSARLLEGLIFPAWVLMISIYILILNYRAHHRPHDSDSAPEQSNDLPS